MEKKKLLSEAALRTTARILLVVYLIFILEAPVRAADFDSALNVGKSMGTGSVSDYNPTNLNQTMQGKGLGTASTLAPRADQASQEKAQYDTHYTSPGGLSSSSSDIGDFVNSSSQSREKFTLGEDPTFGNKCLETDADGKCVKWSTSQDLIKESYPDCETVQVPIYDAPPTEAQCTGTRSTVSMDCPVRTPVRVETEEIYTPCSESTIGYKPGQAYAVCKDYRAFFKVYQYRDSFRDDCYCPNIPGGYLCGDVSPDFVLGSPPAGATYIGKQASGPNTCTEANGWDYGNWTIYNWYEGYIKSVIERVYIDYDSPCGDLSRYLGDNSSCRINKVEQCDPNGNNCLITVEGGMSTGAVAPTACKSFSGSIENYTMCMDGTNVTISNSVTSGAALTQTQQFSSATNYVRAYGGPDVRSLLNGWYMELQFDCFSASDTCQPLKDQGCRMYAQKCVDPTDPLCNHIDYTYQCGGTGGVTGYDVAIVCTGNIRCMGSDCNDPSYKANTDFGSAVQAAEIMNAIRMDGTDAEIFPGKVRECQSGPKNCCNANTGGVSMAQYVMAAKAAAEVYSTLSTGIAATGQAMAASATTAINTVANAAGLATVNTTLTGSTVVSTFAGGSTVGAGGALTTSTISGASGAAVSVTGAGTVGIGASTMMAAAATCFAVVGLIVAAYVILTTVYNIAVACSKDDMVTSIDLGFNLCHKVGERNAGQFLGYSLKKRDVYCCFSSILARLIHEQGRPQLGLGWGSAEAPDCSGFAYGELAALDFSQMDLTEYMQYVQTKTKLTPEETQAIMQKVKDRQTTP